MATPQVYTFDQLRDLIESQGVSAEQLRVMLLGTDDDVQAVVHEIIASYDTQDAARRIARAMRLLAMVLSALLDDDDAD
jgi:hypothetical protein